MAADKFILEAAAQQWEEFEEAKQRAIADLTTARRQGDHDSGAHAIRCIANIEAEQRSLTALHQQYMTAQNPPPPRQTTPEERQAKPLEAMTYDDAIELVRGTSKYGGGLRHDDPFVQAGYAEVRRRRAEGR